MIRQGYRYSSYLPERVVSIRRRCVSASSPAFDSADRDRRRRWAGEAQAPRIWPCISAQRAAAAGLKPHLSCLLHHYITRYRFPLHRVSVHDLGVRMCRLRCGRFVLGFSMDFHGGCDGSQRPDQHVSLAAEVKPGLDPADADTALRSVMWGAVAYAEKTCKQLDRGIRGIGCMQTVRA